MTDTTQIEALEQLVEQTRQLIETMITTDAPAVQLQAISEQLQQLTGQLSQHQGEQRIAPHFNFKAAQSDPRGVVPYSPITGRCNPVAAPIDIEYDADKQELHATINCSRSYEGPPNSIHGGTITGIYDQLLAMASACFGKAGPTAYLNTRFLKPSPLHQDLTFRAWVANEEGRKVTIKGECTLNGEVLTEAEGLFIHYTG